MNKSWAIWGVIGAVVAEGDAVLSALGDDPDAELQVTRAGWVASSDSGASGGAWHHRWQSDAVRDWLSGFGPVRVGGGWVIENEEGHPVVRQVDGSERQMSAREASVYRASNAVIDEFSQRFSGLIPGQVRAR